MAKIQTQLQGIDDVLVAQLGNTVMLQKVSAPFTTVVNRGTMTNLAADLGCRVGIERIMVQQIELVPGEYGPNFEPVYRTINDVHDQMRFVGGTWQANNDTAGQYLNISGSNDAFLEISFYGTGLNLLLANYGGSVTLEYSVDGGSLSANIWPSTISNILASRNYAGNNILPVVSGLTQGFHTVLLKRLGTSTNSLSISGFEILNETSTMSILPGSAMTGGKSTALATLQTAVFNKTATFESGSLGTRGGKVVAYLKKDGTIGLAAQATNGSSTFTSSVTAANRSTEEVTRNIYWREFGAGRSDDLSTLATASTSANQAFTLDDGTTTLAGIISTAGSTNGIQSLYCDLTGGGFLTFTFVGTGLAIRNPNDGAVRTITCYIDGTSIGSVSSIGSNVTTSMVQIASGLPYGTHTFYMPTSSGASLRISDFVVYGPKTPSIPAGAVQLAEWNVLADYVQLSGLSLTSTLTNGKVSQGVIKKMNIREMSYIGSGWSISSIDATNLQSGWAAQTGTANDFFTYTFWGTGCEVLLSIGSGVANFTLSIDGVTNLSGAGYTTSLVSGTTGVTFTASTGAIGGTAAATALNSFSVTGLPLGKHTVKVLNVSTSTLKLEAIDIVTPIYATVASNAPGDIQNTQLVGSMSVGNKRTYGAQLTTGKKPRNWSQAVGVSSGPSTTSTSPVPLADMECVINSQTGLLAVSFWTTVSSSSSNYAYCQAYVDGVAVGILNQVDPNATSAGTAIMISPTLVPVSVGVHTVQVFWYTSGSTLTAAGTQRTLNVIDAG